MIHVVQDKGGEFSGATDIHLRFTRSNCNDLVVVAPLSVIQALTKLGVHPLWAEMQQCSKAHPQAEVSIKGRFYRFVQFKRLSGIQLLTCNIHELNHNN